MAGIIYYQIDHEQVYIFTLFIIKLISVLF
jgi:hypothetical protein